MRTDMVESYVRDLLERITGQRPQPDRDGDLAVTLGGALFYVRVAYPENPVVQVFSVALADLEPSSGLHAALNDINVRLRFARIFYVDKQVLIETEIWGTDVNPSNLDHACHNVAAATDAYGTNLAKQFGGNPRFEESKTAEYRRTPPVSEGLGMYL